jgi:retron-type reverse transcriptase
MNILESISHALMIPEETLEYIIRSAPFRYKVFKVEKRSGKGKRTIAQPAREVKDLQYWVIEKILRNFPIHSAATAYRAGRSIGTNATKHAPNRFLLKMDFKDFFNSIKSDDFETYLKNRSSEEWSERDIAHLKRILFWDKERKGRLVMSVGAPSSPMLSNILMYDFDRKVQAYCARKRVRYSRYADDLTFSTNKANVLREIELRVTRICEEMDHPRLTVNTEKTVHASIGVGRRVTGLVLTNEGNISLGREKKRLIRAQVHQFLVGGLNLEEARKLRGMLAFVNSVEPSFIERLKVHYGSAEIDRVIKMQD